MIGLKLYRRGRAYDFDPRYLQDTDCVICAGRWTAMYYPSTGEWFDIYNRAAPGAEAFGRPGLGVKEIGLREYLAVAGGPGLRRAINCLFGRRLFKFEEPKVLEDKPEREYTDTDEFFLEGPGGGLGDLRPPVIFGGIVTGDTEDG